MLTATVDTASSPYHDDSTGTILHNCPNNLELSSCPWCPLLMLVQISLSPDPLVLKPSCSSDIQVHFRPLVVGPGEGSLKLESAELGVYEWGLRLNGLATNPERSIGFCVPLGNRETQVGLGEGCIWRNNGWSTKHGGCCVHVCGILASILSGYRKWKMDDGQFNMQS